MSDALKHAAIIKAMATLDKAEKEFTFYAEQHKLQADAAYADEAERSKRTAQAARNYGNAAACGDALEHMKLAFGGEP
jgi:hypothetical protein